MDKENLLRAWRQESNLLFYNTKVKREQGLVDYLFAGGTESLSRELLSWMQASLRFTEFVEDYRDKIRKKIRTASEPEGLLDVRAELDIARGLLSDKRVNVNYELGASSKRRIPDFTVTFRENLAFNIEVSRMQANVNAEERIVRILLEKLGQMQPGVPNLLAIHTQGHAEGLIDLGELMHQVKVWADGTASAFYSRSQYESPAAFYKDFNRLNGIVFWVPGGQLWVNKQARPALDEKVLRLVGSLVP
jgi:hypothetical protein